MAAVWSESCERPTLSPASMRMLAEAPWRVGLTAKERALVVATAQERRFASGDWVERTGDLVDHWTGIVDGFVKMSVASDAGRQSSLTGVCPGVWYGEGSLIKNEPRRYDVFALQPTTIVTIPRATFHALRDHSIPFNHHLQDLMNARLALFIGTLAHDRLLDTDARVAYSLGSLFDEGLYAKAPRDVRIGQAEVALLANVSRQRANVALKRFEAAGLVQLGRHGLTVLDVPGLRAFARRTSSEASA